jgi:pathogenesis-related protein 1
MRYALCLLLLWQHPAADQKYAAPYSLSKDMVAAHNSVRTAVKVGPLAWSDKLAAVAQEWADHLLAKNEFAHRPNSRYGENLFEVDGGQVSAGQVVEDWASEAREYDYHLNHCTGVCGHYTQLVWRDTRDVGCAVARGGGREIWVCNYDPPGNVVGRKPY